MAADTFEKCSESVLAALVAGVSGEDAARQHGIASRTIDRWLARGREDRDSKYGPSSRRLLARGTSRRCVCSGRSTRPTTGRAVSGATSSTS